MKAKKNVAGIVWDLVSPVADELGYMIWDVEYVKEGATMILRITIDIDNEVGITIDDCEKMHLAIDPLLDEEDPIPDAYHLEVSSPGIERELKTEAHIAACCGWDVEAKLFTPINGSRTLRGVLLGLDEQKQLHIGTGEPDGEIVLPMSAVSRLSTVYDFTAGA